MSNKQQSVKGHIFGFVCSILLTFFALYIGIGTTLPMSTRVIVIFALAVLQLLIQLIYFMHIGEGNHKFYNFINMAFSIFMAVVIVAGSIWIMLYNTMGL